MQLDDWLAAVDSRALDRDAALETLALRYFQSHGPATDRDFAWWSGLPLMEARAAMRLLGGRLEEQVSGEASRWSMPEAAAYAPPSGDVLRLLSPFDELLVAYKDRSAYDRVSDANEAITFFQPSLLLDGCLVGSWQKRSARSQVSCTCISRPT